jgi:Fe-S cluster assembly protein SufD
VLLSGGAPVSLTNSVTEAAVREGASLDYYKIENESPEGFHAASFDAHLGRNAVMRAHSFFFSGALVRNDLNVTLDGEGAECTLNGLFAADGRRLVDNHTRIDHRQPHTLSRELYEGLLAGSGEGVFNGAIIVRENAEKTNALQYSRNLLLSGRAQINTKPQLEIRNNDVRCAHGATIGQMDPEAVFYLRSRGIGEDESRRMLVRAFAEEVVDGVRVPAARAQIERLLAEWLRRRTGRADEDADGGVEHARAEAMEVRS